MTRKHILIVDDEKGIRQSLSGVLEDDGYTVKAVPGGEACLEQLDSDPPSMVLLDVWLKDIDGLELL